MVGRFFGWIYHLFAGVAGGVWLVVLYIGTIWIVVGSLSAIQVRQTLGDQNQAFTFESVRSAKQKYEDTLARLERRQQQLDWEADDKWRVGVEIDALLRQIGAEVNPGEEILNLYEYPFSADFRSVQAQCKILDPDAAGGDPVCGMIADYEARIEEAGRIDQGEIDTKLEQIRIDTLSKVEELQQQNPLLNYYVEYQFWNFAGYEWLLYMPQQVLVLFLTMAMGVLGSVITMTWSYVRDDSGLTMRRFVVLPLVGSMSAFVILIFVSAGQLTLTAGDDNGTLNPFVLSFLGVISGLLSERAYTRMADVGSNFFRVDDGQPRWANGLKAAMAQAGVSTADLARHLYIAEEEAGRIVNETVTATLEQQRLIAACLRIPVRDIFTDVPPEAAGAMAATVAAPDLAGLDAAAAETALRGLGLRTGSIAEAVDDAAAPGSVIAQRPDPETRLPRGAAVDFTLATARSAPQGDVAPSETPPAT